MYKYIVEYKETKAEKRKPGNPGKNSRPPEIEIKWNLNIQVTGEDEEKMFEFRNSEESFVLITNVKSEENGTGEILGYYKDQYVVEVHFHYFKEPCLTSVIYLNIPSCQSHLFFSDRTTCSVMESRYVEGGSHNFTSGSLNGLICYKCTYAAL